MWFSSPSGWCSTSLVGKEFSSWPQRTESLWLIQRKDSLVSSPRAVFTLTTWTQSSLSGKRETTNPSGQSSLFLVLHPANSTSPTFISYGPLFFSCCWTRKHRYSSLNLFHKFSHSFCWCLNHLNSFKYRGPAKFTPVTSKTKASRTLFSSHVIWIVLILFLHIFYIVHILLSFFALFSFP